MLILLVSAGRAPFRLDFLGILLEIVFLENIKIHPIVSFCLNFFGEGNQICYAALLSLQQCNLLLQRLLLGKSRVIQHGAYLPERELQFPEEQNAAQPAQRGGVVEAVAGFCGLRGL